MKRLFLFISMALFGLVGTVQAQEAKFDEAFIIKKVEKLVLDSQNPKKSGKPEVWIDLGNAYLEAGTVASTGLYRGLDKLMLSIVFPNPVESTENVAGVDYVKLSYPYFDAYLKDDAVLFWKMKKSIVDNALDKAAEAYKKAYELDPKNTKAKVTESLDKIANAYKQDADNLYVVKEYGATADIFAKTYELEKLDPLNKIDTVCCFNAGFLYTIEGKYDKGEKYLQACIDNGYESNGEAFYYLFHSYYGQKNYEKAKETLLAGITKYPKNSDILEQLITLYSETGEDPQGIIPYIQQGIENTPDNPELWSGLGRVYDKLGNTVEAMKAFEKARSLAPDGFDTNYNYALMLIRLADEKTAEFNDKKFTSNEEYAAALKELNQAYELTAGPLEKAHAAKPDDATTIELLKGIYFRLRDVSPEMMQNFEKYDALFKNLP